MNSCTLHSTRRIALVTLLSTACSTGPTAPVRPAVTVVTRAATNQNVIFPLLPPTVRVDVPSATVSGVFVTSTPCYAFTATDEISGRTLLVHLAARKTDAGACVEVLGVFQYTITSHDVPPTITHVRVDQTGAVAGFPSILFDQEVRFAL